MPRVAAPRKTNPPRSRDGGRVVSARQCGDPCVLPATYDSAGARREGSSPAPRPRRRRSSSGSSAAHTGGTARICESASAAAASAASELHPSGRARTRQRPRGCPSSRPRQRGSTPLGNPVAPGSPVYSPDREPPSSRLASPVSGLPRSRRGMPLGPAISVEKGLRRDGGDTVAVVGPSGRRLQSQVLETNGSSLIGVIRSIP